MSLTSSSELTTVIDQLLASSNWHGSATLAAAYVEAVDWLGAKFPTQQSINHRGMTFDMEHLKRRAKEADATIARSISPSGKGFRITKVIPGGIRQ